MKESVENLESMRQGRHTAKPPASAEIASAVSSTVDSVSIYLLDGQSVSFAGSTTLQKVLETLAERFKLTRALDYGVYECPSQVGTQSHQHSLAFSTTDSVLPSVRCVAVMPFWVECRR